MKKITIIIILLIFCLQIKAQSTEFELLTSRTWSINSNSKQNFVGTVGKTNYNKDNITINIYDIYVDGKPIKKIKFMGEFYLSNTPDKVFDKNKKKNKEGKYIILKNKKTGEISQMEIVSINKNKLTIVVLRIDNQRYESESTGIDKIDIK